MNVVRRDAMPFEKRCGMLTGLVIIVELAMVYGYMYCLKAGIDAAYRGGLVLIGLLCTVAICNAVFKAGQQHGILMHERSTR